MMRLLVTRPEADAILQGQALMRSGHTPFLAPVLDIEYLDVGPLPFSEVQALIATSRNGLRALVEVDQVRNAVVVPLVAIGEATGELAHELNFQQVHVGGGTAESLIATVEQTCVQDRGPLLHLAGEHLAFDLKSELEKRGYSVLQPILYRTVSVGTMSDDAQNAITSGGLDGVILMSPRTARIYAGLIQFHGFEEHVRDLNHYCLSETVAEGIASLGCDNVLVAPAPRQDDLLALIGHEAADCA